MKPARKCDIAAFFPASSTVGNRVPNPSIVLVHRWMAFAGPRPIGLREPDVLYQHGRDLKVIDKPGVSAGGHLSRNIYSRQDSVCNSTPSGKALAIRLDGNPGWPAGLA